MACKDDDRCNETCATKTRQRDEVSVVLLWDVWWFEEEEEEEDGGDVVDEDGI